MIEVFESYEKAGITLPAGRTSGQIAMTCPRCSKTRTKRGSRCLSLNADIGAWTCHHCEWVGRIGAFEGRGKVKKDQPKYNLPPQEIGQMSEFWASWLKQRGITEPVIARNRVFSARVYMPQVEEERDALIFSYFRGDVIINRKYRCPEKNFRSFAQAEKILYGINDVSPERLVWVEGEMDKLSVEVAGIESCVSVPMGAPKAGGKNCDVRLSCIDADITTIQAVKKHIIAVDTDANGKELEKELIRRLGAENCWLVSWPDGCKDANDVLRKHGPAAVAQLIDAAVPAPISGVFTADDVAIQLEDAYENGPRLGLSTGWASVDPLYTVRPGEWTVVTGTPSSGKSEWVDAVMVNLAEAHGWRFAVCSPENQPIEYHVEKLMEKKARAPFNLGPTRRMGRDEFEMWRDWVAYHFRFVLPEEPTMDAILSRAKALIRRDGVRGLVIDPWNEIEGSRPSNQTETEYVSSVLGKARRFVRDQGIHLWIVAHPTKIRRDPRTGATPLPTLYDISGSAHWRNKADNGIVVARDLYDQNSPVEIHVQKIRFKAVGMPGMARLRYNRVCGTYSEWEG